MIFDIHACCYHENYRDMVIMSMKHESSGPRLSAIGTWSYLHNRTSLGSARFLMFCFQLDQKLFGRGGFVLS